MSPDQIMEREGFIKWDPGNRRCWVWTILKSYPNPNIHVQKTSILCVLLNSRVVSGLTPVATVSSSGFYPHPWPRTSLRRLAMYRQPESLSLVPRSLWMLCVSSGQRAPSESTFLQCYSVTVGILDMVNSGSLGDFSLTHGKLSG